jgi:hypothetical protein
VTQPILTREFYHDGRGPELLCLHWRGAGAVLAAADYYNPDAPHTPAGVRHLRFVRPQVVQITPEEVIDYGRLGLGDALARLRPAAVFDLGRSAWLAAFSLAHIARCHHYQVMFYDELLDVICEGVESYAAAYVPERAGANPAAAG